MSYNDSHDEVVKKIADEVLGVKSLETQNMDSLDFHELSVWSIKEALIRAVKEGEELGKQQGKG